MTVLQRQIAQATRDTEMGNRARDFIHVAKWMALGRSYGNTLALAQAGRASERIIDAIKAAANAGTTADGTFAAPLAYAELADAFALGLRSTGVFDQALPFAINLPLNMRTTVTTTGLTAAQTGEGQLKIVSRLSVDGVTLTARKCTCIVAVTDELLRNGGTRASNLFAAELRAAVVAATDAAFLSVISSGISPVTSSGGGSSFAVAADMAALLSGLTLGSSSKVFIAMSPSDAKHMAIQIASDGVRAFPSVTINGGDYAGATIVPTDVLTGQLVAFDASQLAMSSQSIELDSSREATIQLDTAPDSPPTASTPVLSFFQMNYAGLRANSLLWMRAFAHWRGVGRQHELGQRE